jgi:3-oxoadipate enol-lactonase / 4-carboxymuconolactone decarboxylase
LPFANLGHSRAFYRLEGNAGLPVLMLSHSIGTDHAMWDPQLPDLLACFQILRYDIRGHGASDAPAGDYSIAQLGQDALSLADSLGLGKFAFCGISLGGAIGQWLASNAPARLSKLVLANTSPEFGPPANWESRRATVLREGTVAIADMAMSRFFSPESLAGSSAASVRSVLLGTDRTGYAGCCAALRDFRHTANLPQIHVPTLVIGGDRDVSTPWAGNGEILAGEIPGACAVQLPAAHLSNLERPRSFSAALLDFLLPPPDPRIDPVGAGFAARRAVLGDQHVDKAIANTNDFNREFQDLITRYAWGTIWTRPGLSHRTRRLLVLATTAALGRWEEFTLHVRAGLAHELEPCDLKEVLLQTAVYAGVPAANTGFHIVNGQLKGQSQEG